MRARLFAVGAVLGLGLLGFAAGASGLEAFSEACRLAKLDAPAAEVAQLEAAGFEDLTPVLPAGLDPDASVENHACAGKIRPGARQSNGCTVSWVFRDQHGAYYQTTAGHCTSNVGQAIGVAGVGTIGTVVWRVNGGVGNDMALIRIDPGMYSLVEPTLCHWGGPTGVATPDDMPLAGNEVMLHYGWGVAYSATGLTRTRAGALPFYAWIDDGSVQMVGLTDGGDSGSPMMLSSGLAAGVHTHRLHPGAFGMPPGPKAATRLDMMIPRVEADLGLDLSIATGAPVDLTGLNTPNGILVPSAPAVPPMLAEPVAERGWV